MKYIVRGELWNRHLTVLVLMNKARQLEIELGTYMVLELMNKARQLEIELGTYLHSQFWLSWQWKMLKNYADGVQNRKKNVLNICWFLIEPYLCCFKQKILESHFFTGLNLTFFNNSLDIFECKDSSKGAYQMQLCLNIFSHSLSFTSEQSFSI